MANAIDAKQKLDLKFGTFEKSPYICTEYIENFMETTALNPTQMHLLKLFAFNNSEEYAREIQEVLTRHFQSRLDAEADRLWDEGILNQEKLDEIRKMDLHFTLGPDPSKQVLRSYSDFPAYLYYCFFRN